METVRHRSFDRAMSETASQMESSWLSREFQRLPEEWQEAIVRGNLNYKRKERRRNDTRDPASLRLLFDAEHILGIPNATA